ncbi:MAG: hypothetical protein ACRDHE_04550 [Ktedonobacterales bacterium]
MAASNDVGGEALLWVKATRSRRFELRAGNDVVASLEWTGSSIAWARGEWGETAYRFNRAGWLRQRVFVRAESAGGAGSPLATYVSRTGKLTFADGRTLLWTKPKRLTNDHIWVDASGGTVARFSPSRGATTLTVSPSAAEQPEARLLALLGQFLLVLAARDVEDATTAAIVTTIVGA